MSEYEDLVELGFEGVDKFATKYHDFIADKVGKTKLFRGGKGKKGSGGKEDGGPQRARSVGERDGGGDGFTGPEPASHRYKRDEPLVPPEDHLRGFPTPPPPPPPPQGPGERQRLYPPFVPNAQPGADPLVPPPPPPMGLQVPRYYEPRALDPSSQYFSASQRQRAPSDPGDYSSDSDSIVSSEKGRRDMYDTYSTAGRAVDGRRGDVRRGRRCDGVYERDAREQDDARDRGFPRRYGDRNDRRRDYSRGGDFGERIVEESEYYTTNPERGVVVRHDAAWDGAVVPRRPDADRYASQAAMAAAYGQARRRPNRRGSSWSPSRRRSKKEDWDSSPKRRPRSRSPNSYRTIGTIVGALAGGYAGRQVKKGEALPNSLATVAGGHCGRIGREGGGEGHGPEA